MSMNQFAEDTPIPESAAPPPAKQPGPFSIGSPLFNIGLVAMLMGISFLAVALPSRTETASVGADDDAPPNVLAFEDPVELRDGSPIPTTTTSIPNLEEVVARLLDERLSNGESSDSTDEGESSSRSDDSSTDDSDEQTDSADPDADVVVPPRAPRQDLVQVVYRTEQVRTPTPPASNPPVAPTTTTPPRPECSDFTDRSEAQTAFDADPTALAHFDGDGDGRACEQIPDLSTPQRITCESFENQPDAQSIYDDDPQTYDHLDGDGDGRACEQLPGAPAEVPTPPPAAQVLSVNAVRQQQGVFGLHTREAPWWMGETDYVTRLIGKAPNNLLFFSNWATPFPAEQVRTAWGRGMTPQVAWEPIVPGADRQPTLREIADGQWDAYIDDWAAAAAAHGQPIVLRFASEMNGNWYSWSEQLNGNNEGDFVDMWRHVHSRFEAAGADNVVWLWSVNRSNNLKTDVATYWPGEQYTDWVGISGYWRGYQGAPEPTFDAIFNQTLTELRALTAKPILLAEIGAGTNVDGDRVNWLNTVFAGLRSNPDIIGFVYFNDTKAGGDWRIQFSQQMVDAFAAGVADDRWKSGALPTGMKIGERLPVPAHSDPNNQGLAGD